ncbi:hypothetical protein PoB_007707600 [Plakobranchus ocellatus]|uniref:Uncharacterized protein n=1 Tax=Plakobranchus ocellatus TaxID=259542 RepID=A0AAV4E2K0_9GAST|nr:hypothetical protein PoB_007707600 [Plakobranchus ocellatus]
MEPEVGLEAAHEMESEAAHDAHTAGPQRNDLRLPGPSPGQNAGSGSRTHGRRVPADLRKSSLSTESPTSLRRDRKTVVTSSFPVVSILKSHDHSISNSFS